MTCHPIHPPGSAPDITTHAIKYSQIVGLVVSKHLQVVPDYTLVMCSV